MWQKAFEDLAIGAKLQGAQSTVQNEDKTVGKVMKSDFFISPLYISTLYIIPLSSDSGKGVIKE